MTGDLPQWPYRKRLTCSVWAVGQKLVCGGKIKVIRSAKVPWLFRVLWSPDPQANYPETGEWFAYVPLKPVLKPWYATLKNSLWFEGRVRQEKPRAAGPKRDP